ncbi:MAG: magnesium transporter [Desulforhopalus sp.]|jgi:magnesium transporter
MIRTMVYNRDSKQIKVGDEKLLSESSRSQSEWIWVDFSDIESPQDANVLETFFSFDPLALSDARRNQHPPKLEQFENYFFLLLKGLDSTTKTIDFRTIQIAFFVNDQLLVTARKEPSLSIDHFWEKCAMNHNLLHHGPAHVVYQISRLLTDRYTGIITEMESRLDELEDEMFAHPGDNLLEVLVRYGKNLSKLKRIFTYHQNIFSRLASKTQSFVPEHGRHEFNDVFEHTERLMTLSTLYKDLTDDLINGYISVTGHRLNQIVKILTIVTTIFLPLTLVVGIYGMNFEYIPELKIKYAYFVLLGFMLSISTFLLYLFRKLKWI